MRLERIQVLRFVAATAVVGFHARQTLSTYVPLTGLIPLSHGNLGVDMFFVISGFIIQLTSRAREQDWRVFLRRRLERVVPLYWVCTLAVFALAHLPGFARGQPASLELLVRSLLFSVWTAAPGTSPVLYVGWSLEYEMFFYLAATAALALFRKPWTILCAVFAVLVGGGALIGVDPAADRLYFFCNPKLLEFAFGVLIALGLEQRRIPLLPGILVASSVLMLLFTPTRGEHAVQFWYAALPAAALVAGAVWLDVARPLHARIGRGFARLGDASYSIYLVHVTVVSATCKLVLRFWPAVPPSLAILAIVIASLILAELVYRLVERRLQALTRRRRDTVTAADPAMS